MLLYDNETLMKFENYLKKIKGFKELIWAREKRIRDENEQLEIKKAKIIGQQ